MVCCIFNQQNKFTVSMRNNPKFNDDSSLTLCPQNTSPGADKEANWLPAPEGAGNHSLCSECTGRRKTPFNPSAALGRRRRVEKAWSACTPDIRLWYCGRLLPRHVGAMDVGAN